MSGNIASKASNVKSVIFRLQSYQKLKSTSDDFVVVAKSAVFAALLIRILLTEFKIVILSRHLSCCSGYSLGVCLRSCFLS